MWLYKFFIVLFKFFGLLVIVNIVEIVFVVNFEFWIVFNFDLFNIGDFIFNNCVFFLLIFNKLLCLFSNIFSDIIIFFFNGLIGGFVIWVNFCLK